MPALTCPAYKQPDDHPTSEDYFSHMIDTMAFFYYWGHSGFLRLHELLPESSIHRRQHAHELGSALFMQDPIVAYVTTPPKDPQQRRAYFDRCKEMSTSEIKSPSDAVLRIHYSSAFVQVLSSELSERYPDDMKLLARILAGAQEKAMTAGGSWESHLAATRKAEEEVAINKLFDRIGDTFTYFDSPTNEVVQYEIINGGGEVAGEAWFWVSKTVAGQSNEDMITAEELKRLLSHRV
ncbi:unnamed protein product [Somion occarium]|uniref:Uncharacterized protein n=1 Tax=Somion occarium TaxID=3059160 RepID=A0ABP1DBX8_9APHY